MPMCDWSSDVCSSDLKWQPNPVFLPGESQGQQSLVGCRLSWMGQWTPCPRGLGEQKLTLLSLHQPFPQPHNPPAASRPPNGGRHPTDSISMNSNGLPIFLNVYSAATLLSSLALPFTSCVTTGQSLTSLSLPFSQTNNKIILLISQGSNLEIGRAHV